ncbi:D-alanyl-D-alanine carboxypeptidase / D-alanyl-D-alanine-endopeptidase (penicillin-binding protein 4) [Paramicrobacterium humi]|uniref:D-alanyl-D-alanine carboxypeptidase / D-alanyl-D-alanine-endopeptidase (Penicillin-binding protein 4) n=1 Tax=Paramicrobacterium humi TaxID=640635 RepID=A0A1H4NL17_9MICO|nr:D-alanyl-D-alanine carboxypeptidase/D-alanyl-D-alanine-endopeptidase [Microbacterium humi]SEB95953.1 D-alanyl-D-alanine carboxypeptidase / D-alanyl-D-alanine-endopeptidase (penicillin-binding protein 4) [Microbacterium humi]
MPPASSSSRAPRRRPWRTAVAAVVFAVLGAGSVAAGAITAPVAAETVTAAPAPTAPARPLAENAVPASGIRQCSVAEQAGNPDLHTLQARVVNATTGEVLFDRDSTTPARTASNLKLLTAAAALETFGAEYRIATPVVAGSEPGTIVLEGRGDLTLTRLPTGQESVYPGAAHLDELARLTKQAWADAGHTEPITRIVLDSSFFGGESWLPEWDTKGMREGYQSHVSALQVDADRFYPTIEYSGRGSDPVARAGDAFAAYFPGATTVIGTAPEGAAPLAHVSSPPLSDLVEYMLRYSDNMIAESLARLVAIREGAGNDFAALDAGLKAALEPLGLDTSAVTIADGSGLSANNAVPNVFFTKLLRGVVDGDIDMSAILAGLPVAGETGTLRYESRFSGDASDAAGHVRAKTGWIQTAYTLSGVIDAKDGATLVFSLYALDDEPLPATTAHAVDELAAAFYRCGDELANT